MNLFGQQLTREEVLGEGWILPNRGGAYPCRAQRRKGQRRPLPGRHLVLRDRRPRLGHRASRLPRGAAGLAFTRRRVNPAFSSEHSLGWLDVFGGGLLTTSGLSAVGQPSDVSGESLSLHGKVSTLPAQYVRHTAQWVQD